MTAWWCNVGILLMIRNVCVPCPPLHWDHWVCLSPLCATALRAGFILSLTRIRTFTSRRITADVRGWYNAPHLPHAYATLFCYCRPTVHCLYSTRLPAFASPPSHRISLPACLHQWLTFSRSSPLPACLRTVDFTCRYGTRRFHAHCHELTAPLTCCRLPLTACCALNIAYLYCVLFAYHAAASLAAALPACVAIAAPRLFCRHMVAACHAFSALLYQQRGVSD